MFNFIFRKSVLIKEQAARIAELESELQGGQTQTNLEILQKKQEQNKEILNSIKNAIGQSNEIIEGTSSELVRFEKEVAKNNNAVASITEIVNKVSVTFSDLTKPLERVLASTNQLKDLDQKMKQLHSTIDQVLAKSQEINDISFQAKLLSFNASVEAARAGEAGKGFAIVAQEVGNLAKNSQVSAEEIAKLISETTNFINDTSGKIAEQVDGLQTVVDATKQSFSNSENKINHLGKVGTELKKMNQQLSQNLKKFSNANNNGLESLAKCLNDCLGLVEGSEIIDLNVTQVAANLEQYEIIDVRRDEEYTGELGHIKGSKLMTLQDALEDKIKGLNRNKKYLFVCRSGGRSAKAARIALDNDFSQVFNMAGGMLAWNEKKYPIQK